MKFIRLGCAAVASMLASAAFAHHSFAMFDQSKQVTLAGTVTSFQWTNPHAWIHIAASNPQGKAENWEIELNSPNNLQRQGWRSNVLKPGDKITLILNPLRDGSKGGLFISVTLPDGKVLGDPTRRGGPINVPVAAP